MNPLGNLEDGLPRLGDEPLRGWRKWSVADGDLRSLNGIPWPHREPFVAACEHPKSGAHPADEPAPQRACTCGHYAAKSLALLADSGYGLAPASTSRTEIDSAYGAVKLWGRVVPHARGFRAQYAYPEFVIVRDPLVAKLIARNYGCEVMLADTPPAAIVPDVPVTTVPPLGGGGVRNVRAQPPQGHVGGSTPMIGLDLTMPNGQRFSYQGIADSAALAHWFAGFAETFFVVGLEQGMWSWQLSARAWWA